MSKAFTKDEDGSDAPVFVSRRAPLPRGKPNYVTARGLRLLRDELAALQRTRAERSASDSDPERARSAALHSAAVAELEQRIASAVPVDPAQQPQEEVRFGATVRVRASSGLERRYRIVGVDEADASSGNIAFVAPLASALLGRGVGESVEIRTPAGLDELTLLAIDYE